MSSQGGSRRRRFGKQGPLIDEVDANDPLAVELLRAAFEA